jgi:uncharacterized protein YecT (DUF1311 family)
MSEIVTEKLIALISRYGPTLVDEEVRTRGLLKDVCGELHSKEVIALVSVIQEGIARDLLALQNKELIYARIARGSQRLHDHRGLTKELAAWSVEAWAIALGILKSTDLMEHRTSVAVNAGASESPDTANSPPTHLVQQSQSVSKTSAKSMNTSVAQTVAPVAASGYPSTTASSNSPITVSQASISRRKFSGVHWKYVSVAGALFLVLVGYTSYPILLTRYDSFNNKSRNNVQASADGQQSSLKGIVCDGPVSVQDKVICMSPVLLAKDKALTVRFEESIRGLSQDAVDTVKAGQLDWKEYWPRVCSKDASKVSLPNESVACISEEYDKRTNQLNAAKEVNGSRIYQVDFYEIRTSDPSDTYGPAKHSLRFPQFDVGNPQFENNARLQSLNGWLRGNSVKWLQDLDNQRDTILSNSVEAVTIDILKSSLYNYEYPHGAAHELNTLGSSYYLVNTGRLLLATDIFQGTTWIQVVADFAYDSLSKSLGVDSLIVDRSAFDSFAQDISGWEFASDGLILNFNPYQVAPYAAGHQSTKIPWEMLNQYLTLFAKSQLEQFSK